MNKEVSFLDLRSSLVEVAQTASGENWPPGNVPRVYRFEAMASYRTGMVIAEANDIDTSDPSFTTRAVLDTSLASRSRSVLYTNLANSIRRTGRGYIPTPEEILDTPHREPIITMEEADWDDENEPEPEPDNQPW